MREITAQGKIPLLVGGTMLYFQALQKGLAELPAADPDLRARLDEEAHREGWPALHRQLADLDPVTADRLQPTDAQRIQRALEVCLLAGEAMSELQKNTTPPIAASYLNIGLLPSDRQQLHARIAARLSEMLDDGFMEELRALSEMPGMSADTPAMRAVGYRQLWPCLINDISQEAALEKGVTATRRLAKRQLTWLRSWPDLHVVDCLSDTAAIDVGEIVKTWLDVGATAGINR
jgi:tRNA dimethylallyltransferase